MVYGSVCHTLPGNIPDLFGRACDITSWDLSKEADRALGWRHGWDTDTYSAWCDGDLSPKRRRSASGSLSDSLRCDCRQHSSTLTGRRDSDAVACLSAQGTPRYPVVRSF